jgi:fumarate reductase flavoprotein subunit
MVSSDSFDVVIAGAGGAGLTAALAAAEQGLSVLLLDHDENFRRGCNTFLSTAMIPAAGSRWQLKAGIEDSPELFRDDIRAKTGGDVYEVLVKALTEVGPELVNWLADKQALPLSLATDFTYPGHSRHRCHSVADRSGRTLHSHMAQQANAHPNITLAVPLDLQAVSLGGDGRVDSAVIAAPGGAPETVSTRAVVLATSGFGGNPEWVRRHIPEIAEAAYFGSEADRGDGIRIGIELGADTGYLDAYQGHGSLASPHRVLVTWATVMHGGVILNSAGRRFEDETIGYSEFARHVLGQPGRLAWAVIDHRIDELCRPFADYNDLIAQGAVRWCDSPADVAALIGAGEQSVTETLAEATACSAGAADRLGRTFWEAALELPYGVVRVTGALFHTQGGLLVDPTGAVLRGGHPIHGLYAAGGAAVGISGHGPAGYLAGNGLLSAFGLGFIVGRTVASGGRTPA